MKIYELCHIFYPGKSIKANLRYLISKIFLESMAPDPSPPTRAQSHDYERHQLVTVNGLRNSLFLRKLIHLMVRQ